LEDGTTQIVRPRKNGGPPRIISVPVELAGTHRLAAGDIVVGETEALDSFTDHLEATDCQLLPIEEDVDLQYDEPARIQPWSIPRANLYPCEILTAVSSINGLSLADSEERPYPKSRRSQSERTTPDRLLSLARGERDTLGRMLDFAAPLGCGDVGAIMGPHNSGLTRTFRSLIEGIATNSPDCVVIVMMIKARGEEVTEFRSRFPNTDIVVCQTDSTELSPQAALIIPNLLLEVAQRQSEMGRDVVVLIDSLTGLWGMMLESEDASDQRNADLSKSRQRIREYLQKAGCFHGETPLGGSLGGSISIIGTVWSQPVNEEAEDDRELHPHLRLFEQIVSDLSWRVVLDPRLAEQRLYPAIDVKRCMSRYEETLLDPAVLEALFTARGSLPRNETGACYMRMMDALDEPGDLAALCGRIVGAKAT
jgi:transcription termination factor Rho